MPRASSPALVPPPLHHMVRVCWCGLQYVALWPCSRLALSLLVGFHSTSEEGREQQEEIDESRKRERRDKEDWEEKERE